MKVMWPHEFFVFQRRINVYLVSKLYKDFLIMADLNLYELVLYNLFLNGIKFNKAFDGDIVISVECKPCKELFNTKEKKFILETQVIDTGSGIEQER